MEAGDNVVVSFISGFLDAVKIQIFAPATEADGRMEQIFVGSLRSPVAATLPL
jgi:hypothetical protein